MPILAEYECAFSVNSYGKLEKCHSERVYVDHICSQSRPYILIVESCQADLESEVRREGCNGYISFAC